MIIHIPFLLTLESLSILGKLTVSLALIWILYWKGVGLWKSARQNEVWWFVALLLVQTFGLLEILYIYVFSKKKKEEQ